MTIYAEDKCVKQSADVHFTDESVPDDRRAAIQRSIDAMVSRRVEENARRQSIEADDAELAEAIRRPMIDYVQRDPHAAAAIRRSVERSNARALPVLDLSPHVIGPQPSPVASFLDFPVHRPREFEGFATEVFVSPYQFSWSWHDLNGGAPHTQIIQPNIGRIGLDARSGNVDGSTGGFVNAHAGFGVHLRSTVDVEVMARSFRTVKDLGRVAAGFTGDGTSEGGTEMTVMQNGKLITMANETRWHERVGGTVWDPTPSATYDNGGFDIGEMYEVRWEMKRDTNYELNVGAWVLAQSHHGIGGGAALSQIDTRMVFMSLWR